MLALVGCFLAAVMLIPDRYTVPLDARLGLRPYQLVIVVLITVLGVRFVHGRRLAVGRPALVAGGLVVVAVASIVVNLDRLSESSFLGAVRLTVTFVFYVLLAVAIGAVAITPKRRRFVLGMLVTFLAVGALFAAHESSTRQPVRINPTPPGLVEEDDPTVQFGDTPRSIVRNGVTRPAGLAANPLELGAVMTLAAPFAVYLALSARRLSSRLWFLTCATLIILAIALSMSRTGVLASAVMLVVALLANIRRPRLVFVGLAACCVLGFTVSRMVPQSVDSLIEQIGKDGNEDPSLATRLEDYAELDDLLGPHPWLGGGPGSVSAYVSRDGTAMILDNQYLLSIAETGVIGLVALAAVMWSTATGAMRRMRAGGAERGLYVAVLSATAGFAVMCATFDALRFGQATSVFMIAVGLAAAGGTAVSQGCGDVPAVAH